ncbi:guanylin-like [Scleropages formosus]|uniref:Guanylate cyclase activator 2B n=1 Tax=Scleropages formosus TaxID=113540 RepID=A0A8C9R8M2_SCLFO|nr:guanylin-like [Scleropages formosus]
MSSFSVSLLLVPCLLWSSEGVMVQDGPFSFPLESVKLLKAMIDGTRLTKSSPASVCTNPGLPEELQPLCQSEEASAVFSRLIDIITPPDPCEICVNAACTGCL